jgi:hypothetical protein
MKICPLTADPCLEHGCEWYIHIVGANPQSGEQIDKFGCSITFLPMLLIENSQQQRQTGAAVESFRNEMIVQNQDMLDVQKKLISTPAVLKQIEVMSPEDEH